MTNLAIPFVSYFSALSRNDLRAKNSSDGGEVLNSTSTNDDGFLAVKGVGQDWKVVYEGYLI